MKLRRDGSENVQGYGLGSLQNSMPKLNTNRFKRDPHEPQPSEPVSGCYFSTLNFSTIKQKCRHYSAMAATRLHGITIYIKVMINYVVGRIYRLKNKSSLLYTIVCNSQKPSFSSLRKPIVKCCVQKQ